MASKKVICFCLVLVVSFLIALESAWACGNGKLILEDKFATLDPAWGFSAENPDRSNGPDGLIYKIKDKDDGGAFLLNQSGLYQDYEVCIDFKVEAQKDTSAYAGVAIWASDSDNAYEVDIFPVLGTYAVYRYQKGKTLKPLAPKASSEITKGLKTTNELSVTVKGNKAEIIINGEKVTDFMGQPPAEGSLVGLALGLPAKNKGPATFTVSSFQLRELE